MKIVVLLGGTSDERDVSLWSGCQVAAALREAGHSVVAWDTVHGALTGAEERRMLERGVGTSGSEIVIADEARSLIAADHEGEERPDVFFLALHGGTGEDGTLQAMLDLMGVPYTGSGLVGCALAMDKDLSKRLMREAGIDTPDWLTGERSPDEVEEALGLPVIVKAANGGSSLRLILAHDRPELERAIEAARDFDDLVVFERYVAGRELTVGILGREALPVGEIIPEHEFFDYECKYQPGMAREVFPADVPGETARRLQRLALEVHDALRLEDFSRVDFMLDGDGRAWCLEANALPGLTPNSLVPKAALAAGIDFPELCERLAKLALERRSRELEGGRNPGARAGV